MGDSNSSEMNRLVWLSTNGNYDRSNITRKIEAIQKKIVDEFTQEIIRLDTRSSQRLANLQELTSEINTICQEEKNRIKSVDPSETYTWKENLEKNLTTAIKKKLVTSELDKYTSREKIGIHLLNLITVTIFPLAMLKYTLTSSAFFSARGHTHDVVEKTLNFSKRIK